VTSEALGRVRQYSEWVLYSDIRVRQGRPATSFFQGSETLVRILLHYFTGNFSTIQIAWEVVTPFGGAGGFDGFQSELLWVGPGFTAGPIDRKAVAIWRVRCVRCDGGGRNSARRDAWPIKNTSGRRGRARRPCGGPVHESILLLRPPGPASWPSGAVDRMRDTEGKLLRGRGNLVVHATRARGRYKAEQPFRIAS